MSCGSVTKMPGMTGGCVIESIICAGMVSPANSTDEFTRNCVNAVPFHRITVSSLPQANRSLAAEPPMSFRSSVVPLLGKVKLVPL